MINTAAVEKKLRLKYNNLEQVAVGVLRAIDKYADRAYAIRYFDLTDDLIGKVDKLHKYQEEILSDTYFSGKTSTDLRWNHYLYFVTSTAASQRKDFSIAKAKVEEDREYARKTVILEEEVDSFLTEPLALSRAMPDDLASIWMNRLEKNGLAFVLDEDVTVPEAARLIASGRKQKAEKIVAPSALTLSEKAAAKNFLRGLTIIGFRPYPQKKTHEFGKVNLIVGNNGSGKTSLLEAIEYLFCGQIRRPGELMPNTAVSAELFDSKEKLVTSTTTTRQQLRARHSQWYAKTELKTVTLSDSFGKFNFLDSDAAVHLSVDDSEERIGHDVMRLLLGSNAERLSDRLQRLNDRLEEFAREREREVTTFELLLSAAQQHLDELQKAPQTSDSLFMDLCVTLKQLNWRVVPATKQEASSIRENLQVAISATQILVRSSIDAIAADESALLDRRVAVMAAIESVTKLNERLEAASLNLAEADRNQATLRARHTALDALLAYAEANYSKKTDELAELRQRVSSLAMGISSFGEELIGETLREVFGVPLGSAAATATAVFEEKEKHLANARRALKVMEDTLATVSVLRQRLIKVTREWLSNVPNPDHCPVCQTAFSAEQLRIRMLSGDIEESESQLNKLQLDVLLAERELMEAQHRSVDISRLLTFVGNQTDMTVGEAVKEVAQTQQVLTQKRIRFAELETHLESLAARGLREEELKKYLKVVGLERLVEVSDILSRKASTSEQLKKEINAEELANNTLKSGKSTCEQCALRFGVNIDISPEELVKQLRTQASGLDAIIKAKGDLTTLLILKGKTLEALTVQLEQAQSHLQTLTTVLAKESTDVSAAALEEENIKKLNGQNTKAKSERQRLQEASTLLGELIKLGIGGELASQILNENASAIGQIFVAIHTPNEFEVTVEEGKLIILRRETSKAVSLFEMSTGQRAAYALSLFLAMNARIRSGPRVLLFDDPIAHVDDMNALSFLDNLRNQAIKGSRQIFFATANNKVAGLFRQKFRFLGKADFREIELTRV